MTGTTPIARTVGTGRVKAAAFTVAMAVVFAGVTLITPSLTTYRAMWDLSVFDTTAVFVAYVPGVVLSLFAFGGLADVFGAPMVLGAGLGLSLLSTALSFLAQGPLWLIGARVVLGVGVGLIPGATAAGIASTGHAPATVTRLVAIATTLGIAGGLVFGALGAGQPHVLLVAYFIALVPFAVWVVSQHRTRVRRADATRRVAVRFAVPRDGRGAFLLSLAVVAVAFAGMGLFAGLGPALLGGSDSATAGAAVGAAAYVVSCALQLRGRLVDARIGGAALAMGMLALAIAVAGGDVIMLLIAAVLVGAGNGVLFRASFALAGSLAPRGHRAGVVSTYYLAMYAGIAAPLLALGALADAVSLATAVAISAPVIGIAAIGCTVRARSLRRMSSA